MEKKICNLIDQTKQNLIEKYKSDNSKGWTKFYGDICTRIFSHFIANNLSNDYKVSEPNAYIIGFHIEFDLLIVKNCAKKAKFTNAYYPKDVISGIEFKAKGVYGGRKELDNVIMRIKRNFVEVNERYKHIKFVYLTYKEVANPKKKSSINYLAETKRYLESEYKVFCLKDSRTNIIIPGQWNEFSKAIV